jgi:hypothetical protein
MTPHPPSERAFGRGVGSVLLALSVLTWWRDNAAVAAVLGIVGSLLVGFGSFYPSALRGPNRVWWRFAQALGWFNTRVLLTLFFGVVLTPVGIVMRACGRNPLRASRGASNWTPYPARRRDSRHYERMY